MTIDQYRTAVAEAANYTDRDAYISDLALSAIWGDPEDADIPADRLDQLGQIWDACHRSVKEIAAAAGLSQRKLAERFCIPYRTVGDWCTGQRACNLYIRLMMQECLGLIKSDGYRYVTDT